MSGSKSTPSNSSTVPGWMGYSLPIVGNPYSLTKKVYYNAAKPIGQKVMPIAKPIVGVAGKIASPIAGPVLRSVGIESFAPLSPDSKGNATVVVLAEGDKVQKVIGGKVSEEQEFDVFVARLSDTVKGIRKPTWLGGGKEE
ncbi:hypothetical protein TrRE_jg1849 [Triparma retinervis]|uniref:Uncharacterized protein n=1 Tax=Triparma retinervis TaxID=2557542 RepID=A0A9W6ZT49_9STRA|nr:hypothetical protein TrRE_jg1849 [Triparma retinervis]